VSVDRTNLQVQEIKKGSNQLKTENKVSLLLPVHNEELYLSDLVRSLSTQARSFELVIVDDHSTDGTLALAEELARTDSRIRVFSNRGDRGIAPTVNVAYSMSTGTYVTMIGGDDTVRSDYLEAIYRAIGDVDGRTTRVAIYCKLTTVSDEERFNGQVIPRGKKGNRSGPCMIYSRALADQVYPLPPGLFQEDAWIWVVGEKLAETVIELTEPIYNYRIHLGNTNPRHLSWDQYDAFMRRYTADYVRIRERLAGEIDSVQMLEIDGHIRASELRNKGRTVQILFLGQLSIVQRLRFAESSSRHLHSIRSRFYKVFSGW
jgi:glycosyltransferase involved in cell wall biosynthesis